MFIEHFVVIDVLKMRNVALVLVCDAVVHKGGLLLKILGNWWWFVLDAKLLVVISFLSPEKELLGSLFSAKHWVHVLLV